MNDDETPFNQLPEDEQVKRMGKSAPHFTQTKGYQDKLKEGMEIVEKGSIATLVPNKTDADYAAEIKQKIIEAYGPLFEVLQEADKKGFVVQSQVGKDFSGKFTFAQLQVMKVYG